MKIETRHDIGDIVFVNPHQAYMEARVVGGITVSVGESDTTESYLLYQVNEYGLRGPLDGAYSADGILSRDQASEQFDAQVSRVRKTMSLKLASLVEELPIKPVDPVKEIQVKSEDLKT